jgi:hypothetical protein
MGKRRAAPGGQCRSLRHSFTPPLCRSATSPLCHCATLPLLPFLGFSFPYDDWQFWAATAVFVGAAAWLLKGLIPVPLLSRRHRRRKAERRATLTIGGEAVKRRT